MLRDILKYGLIGGIIVGVLMAISIPLVHGSMAEPYAMAIGYLTILIALSAVFVAIKRRRDEALGGIIRFWPAFAMGLGISIIASILYALAWEAILPFMGGDVLGQWIAQSIAEQKAKGVSGEALAKFVAQMEQLRRDYANPLYRIPMSFTEIFPVGVLVSLVSAGLLRNSRFLPARRPLAAD